MASRGQHRQPTACRAIADNLINGVWQFDGDGRTTFANPAMATMLGCHAEDMASSSIYEFLGPRDTRLLKRILRKWKTGQCSRLQLVFRCRDGRAFFAECGLSQTRLPGNTSPCFLACISDVTRRITAEDSLQKAQAHLEHRVNERTQDLRKTIKKYRQEILVRKWAEEELRRSEARLHAIIEDQVELVCRFRPDFTITFVNDSYCRYFGLNRDAVLGSSLMTQLPNDERLPYSEAIEAMSPDNAVIRTLHKAAPKTGNESGDTAIRWQEWSTRALFDDSGACVELQAVGRDVSKRIKAQMLAHEAERKARGYRANLEAVFRSIPDAILTVDKDMRILNTNDSIMSLCCEAREMTAGKSLLDVCRGQVQPCMRVLLKTLKTRKPVSEYRVECSVGTSPNQVMLLNSSPCSTRKGFSGAVLLIRDITRLAELERRLDERSQFEHIVGKSQQMQQVFATLEQLVDLDTTVLITGESGTGKECIVDALHYFGSRDTGPLIKVNCSALPEGLLESELFGHVRGAFTGAVKDKIGRFQAAEKGTIFLDEIGDISPAVQLKLLRVLEQKEFERVGDSTTIKADVRVLAATNTDLRDKVLRGEFRDDLFYRLQVMVIHLPPLRERDGDTALLVEHFLHHFREQLSKDIVGVDEDAMRLLLDYSWPGNVRELKHTIEHACILCPGGHITRKFLPAALLDASVDQAGMPLSAQHVPSRSQRLLSMLEQTRWNKAEAARRLGISRQTLYRHLRELEH